MGRLKLWDGQRSWQEAEALWEQRAAAAAARQPLKGLKALPRMVGISPDTAAWLRWKSFKWIVRHDSGATITRAFLRHPLRYSWNYLRSLWRGQAYRREGDFFYYGLAGPAQFEQALRDPATLLVVGFSYCHKPFECPAGRFSDRCINDGDHDVCRQCFIGKCMEALPRRTDVIPLVIPTVHYIGNRVFELSQRHPRRNVLFLITACELTLTMFADWGNMVGIKGIGVRLDGRICNTMEAFALSERGVKPGLTVVLPETQQRLLQLLRCAAIAPDGV